jgi:hypothetical protein
LQDRQFLLRDTYVRHLNAIVLAISMRNKTTLVRNWDRKIQRFPCPALICAERKALSGPVTGPRDMDRDFAESRNFEKKIPIGLRGIPGRVPSSWFVLVSGSRLAVGPIVAPSLETYATELGHIEDSRKITGSRQQAGVLSSGGSKLAICQPGSSGGRPGFSENTYLRVFVLGAVQFSRSRMAGLYVSPRRVSYRDQSSVGAITDCTHPTRAPCTVATGRRHEGYAVILALRPSQALEPRLKLIINRLQTLNR